MKTGDWATTTIKKETNQEKRSYTAQTTDGDVYRRNCAHLKPQNTTEPSKLVPDDVTPSIPEAVALSLK